MKSEKLSEEFDLNSFKSKAYKNLEIYKQLRGYVDQGIEWETENHFKRMQEIFEELTDLCADAFREFGSKAISDVVFDLTHEEYEKEDGKYELVFNKTLQLRFLDDVYEKDEKVVDITRRATRETIEEETEKAVNA